MAESKLYRLIWKIKLKILYRIKILDPLKTIQIIKKEKKSIARFGDGEITLMLQNDETDEGIIFQQHNTKLSERLNQIFAKKSDSLLICFPWGMNSFAWITGNETKKWFSDYFIYKFKGDIYSIIKKTNNKQTIFGDSNVSRPFVTYKDRYAEKISDAFSSLWEDRDVLIVEGKLTRLGVGNDLFKNVKSIKRILIPVENAFSKYDEIMNKVLECYKDQLVLIAAGPTATVLAYDLSLKGIQALDVGHIDIDYEWHLHGDQKVNIPNKYTAEACDGVRFVDNGFEDKDYSSSIIAEI